MAAARWLAAVNRRGPWFAPPNPRSEGLRHSVWNHQSHQAVHNRLMKRATITLPDDLPEAVDHDLRAQEIPPSLTAIAQTGLREYLRGRGFLPARRLLKIGPAKRESGRSDVTENHDFSLAGVKK